MSGLGRAEPKRLRGCELRDPLVPFRECNIFYSLCFSALYDNDVPDLTALWARGVGLWS